MDEMISAFRRDAESEPGYWAQRAMSAVSIDLKRLMVKRGLTRAQFAEKIGKSKAYVSKVFNDDVNFTLATLTSLAEAMGGRLQIRIVPIEDCQPAQAGVSSATAPAAPRVMTVTLTPDLMAAAGTVSMRIPSVSSNSACYDFVA